MGVLHIAISPMDSRFAGAVVPFFPGRGKRIAAKRVTAKPAKSSASESAPVVRREKEITQMVAQRDTLHQSQQVVSVAVVERTAEQELLERLVAQCMLGDSAAWQQLVVSQHRRIYGICYRFTGSPTDAEDLTQEVFLKVYRNLESFDATKGGFQTWMTALTRNLLVDHFRRTRQDRVTDSMDASLSEDGDGPTMADRLSDPRKSQHDHVAQQELRARIQHALKQLSPELREAVILRDLEELDYKEIAVVLRVPEGTVKSRISRGRGELARLLQRIEGQVV
jgi:RNA polymerase sigma-70 factor, ECF subfamily